MQQRPQFHRRPSSRYASDEEEEDEGDKLETQFKECMEALSEKRAGLRENGLKGLHKLMCDNFMGEIVQSKYGDALIV